MSVSVIPFKIRFEKWAAQFCFIRPDLEFPIPMNHHHWRDWAQEFYLLNQQTFPDIPIPKSYFYPKDDDWRQWASQVIYILS